MYVVHVGLLVAASSRGRGAERGQDGEDRGNKATKAAAGKEMPMPVRSGKAKAAPPPQQRAQKSLPKVRKFIAPLSQIFRKMGP